VDLIDMKYNKVWDGVFHAFTWTTCLIGLALLFRAGRARLGFAITRSALGVSRTR
jgi:uncharacterized membrane protein